MSWVRSPWVASRSDVGPTEKGPTEASTAEGTAEREPWCRDRHGWHSVGDHGQWIAPQRFAVSGRGLGTATVGGHTVDLDTVESTLRNAPGVRELICVAIPHRRFGECIVATLRPEPGTDPVPQLRSRARQLLPAAARPVRYLARPEWPVGPGGKVSRTSVREEVLRAVGRSAPQADHPRDADHPGGDHNGSAPRRAELSYAHPVEQFVSSVTPLEAALLGVLHPMHKHAVAREQRRVAEGTG